MNMKMKSTVAGVVLALVAGVAHAGGGTTSCVTPYNLGTVANTAFFGDCNISAPEVDAYTFKVPTSGTYDFVGSTVIAGADQAGYNYNFTGFNLMQGATVLQTGSTGSSGHISYNGILSAANTYSLVVTGSPTNVGAGLGSYGGSVSVSAVPETGTLPLSVLGLGVVALIARRNKKTA